MSDNCFQNKTQTEKIVLCFELVIAILAMVVFVLSIVFPYSFPYGTTAESAFICLCASTLAIEIVFAKNVKKVCLATIMIYLIVTLLLRFFSSLPLILVPFITWGTILLVIVIAVVLITEYIKCLKDEVGKYE